MSEQIKIEKSCNFCQHKQWYDHDLMFGCRSGLYSQCKQGNTYTLFEPDEIYKREAAKQTGTKPNKRVQFRIDLQIEAMFDPSKLTDLEQVKQTAIGLALNPNYHTIDNGVQLTRTDYVYIAD